MKMKKNIIGISILLAAFAVPGCNYTPLNPPKPKADVELLLGLVIASNAALDVLTPRFSSCESADGIAINEGNPNPIIRRTHTSRGYEVKWYQLTNGTGGALNNVPISVVSTSSRARDSFLCLLVGRENQLVDTNSPVNAFQEDNCVSSFELDLSGTPDAYTCVGVLTSSRFSAEFRIGR
jgi:hypothetical protein